MNATIELHDSELTGVIHEGTSAVLLFSPAYIHRSPGRPGMDAGSGWTQTSTLEFAEASVSAPVELPSRVSDGWLRIGGVRHANHVPTGESFEAPCELWLVLQNGKAFTVRGTRLIVTLQGEPHYVEEFAPRHPPDIE